MTPDPHMPGYCRQYRRSRRWWNGCQELVPLQQDERFRGNYCAAHLTALRERSE